MLGACTVTIAVDAARDEAIRQLCRAQRGRVARWQLLDAGLQPDAIDRCLRSGRLFREHEGVYAMPPLSEQIELGPEAAAVLAGGPGTCLSHHSAAVLWLLRPGRANPVHVTVPYGRRGPAEGGLIVHRSRILRASDVEIHRGLPVTSPARTLLDVAATLPERDVERLLDEALFFRRILVRRDVEDILRRAGGHPGRARLAGAARIGMRRRTDSQPEERLLQLILAAGLPEPRTQAAVLEYRLDLYWPELSLAVEVDTYATHGSPRRFAADRRRDARLLAERGIAVLRFTEVQIERRPLEVIATLARALAGAAGR